MPPDLDIDEDGGGDDSESHQSHSGPMSGFSESQSDAEAEENMTIGRADLGLDDDNDIVAGFDGVDETESESDGESSSSSSGGSGSSSSSGDVTIESAIEEGLAEAAAVGLRGKERERVSGEMEAVASKFKVGYFGNQVAQKYLKKDIEDIPPEWGLLATLVAFSAFAIYKRPDGEEQVRHAVSIVKDRLSSDDPQPQQQQQPRQQAPQQMSQRRGPPPEPQASESGESQSAQSEPSESKQSIEQEPMTEATNE